MLINHNRKPTEVAAVHVQRITSLPTVLDTNQNCIHSFTKKYTMNKAKKHKWVCKVELRKVAYIMHRFEEAATGSVR